MYCGWEMGKWEINALGLGMRIKKWELGSKTLILGSRIWGDFWAGL